jgi:hypothetical protein
MKGRKNVSKILVTKPLQNCPFGRPRNRWDNNIKAGCEDGM